MLSIPETMTAAVATGFGSIYDNIFLRKVDVPPIPYSHEGLEDGTLLIQVLNCALAPGDVRGVLSGRTSYIQLPPGGHPYIVGSDVSGIVVKVSPDETKFRAGDYVVNRFDEPKPQRWCCGIPIGKNMVDGTLSYQDRTQCGMWHSSECGGSQTCL